MKTTAIATAIVSAPATVQAIENKQYMQLVGPKGAKLYVAKPNKSDVCTHADLSGWAWGGLDELKAMGLEVPADAAKVLEPGENGNVSVRVDLRKVSADWLSKAITALNSVTATTRPGASSRTRGSKGPAPSLASAIASLRAQSVASAAAQSEEHPSETQSEPGADEPAIGDDFSDAELEALTAPAAE